MNQYKKADGTIVRGHNRRGVEHGAQPDGTAAAACAAAEAGPGDLSRLGNGEMILAEEAQAALGRHMTASEIAASGQTYRADGWYAEPRGDGGALFHVEIGASGPAGGASDLPAGMEWQRPKRPLGTPMLVWNTDDQVDLTVDAHRDAGVRLEGSGRGNVVRRGTGTGIVVRAGSGEGNAENYSQDESAYGSDALREGSGHGNALRRGAGNARREGSGNGNAYKHGQGNGDARNNSSGRGNAFNDSDGIGSAVREGTGSGHAERDGAGYGNALNTSDGAGDAVRKGDGAGEAVRAGSGDGASVRSGSGKGSVFRSGKGSGNASIEDSAVGDAVRSGMGKGNAESTTTGHSDAFKIGPGNGKALRWNGDGNTYVSGKRNKQAISYRGTGGKGDAFLASDCRGAATNKSEHGGGQYVDENWQHWRVPTEYRSAAHMRLVSR